MFKVDFEQPVTVKALLTKRSENDRDNYVMKYEAKYSNKNSSWIIVMNGTSKVSHTCIMLIFEKGICQFAMLFIYLHFRLQERHTFIFVNTI